MRLDTDVEVHTEKWFTLGCSNLFYLKQFTFVHKDKIKKPLGAKSAD